MGLPQLAAVAPGQGGDTVSSCTGGWIRATWVRRQFGESAASPGNASSWSLPTHNPVLAVLLDSSRKGTAVIDALCQP